MLLTAKQEKFIRNIVQGMSQREAYKNSYDAKNMKNETIDKRASELFNKREIKGRYEQLLERLEDKAVMSAIERKKWLTRVINNEEETEDYCYDDGDRFATTRTANFAEKMKAMDILNKMDGQYVTKMEGNLDVTIEVDINEN